MSYRQSYSESEALLAEVLELLSTVFPFFREQETAARCLGLRWEARSTPFVYRKNGQVVAHVGVLRVPLVLDGKDVVAGSVHAVATHPEHRRRGYYRTLMEEVLAWCHDTEGFETLHLCTDNPEYFEPFGFRIVDEHRFVGVSARAPALPSASFPAARLGDPTLLRRLLAQRDPVSRVLGTRDRDVFLFNEARHELYYAADLDAALSFDVEDGILKLWDVVSPRMPTLAEILARVPASLDFERVEVHFTPDRLGSVELEPVRESRDEDVILARGPYPVEGKKVKLPATVRC